LTGGVPRRLAPLGPDLNLAKGWKFEEFVTTMRSGVDPIAKLVRAFGADPVAR
jgi:hypothetical protein